MNTPADPMAEGLELEAAEGEEELEEELEEAAQPPPPRPPVVHAAPPAERPAPPPRVIPDEVTALLEQFGEDAGYTVRIERAYPMECAGYQYTVPLDNALNEDEIKRTCGGRVFRLKVYDPNFRYVTQRTIRIDADPLRDGKPIVDAPAKASAPSEISELAGVLREMLTRQQAAAERQQALIEKLLLEPADMGGDDRPDAIGVLEQTAAVIAAVKNMAPSLGGGGEGGEDPQHSLILKFGEKLLDRWDDKEGKKDGNGNGKDDRPPGRTIQIYRRPPALAGAPPAPGAPPGVRPGAPPGPPAPPGARAQEDPPLAAASSASEEELEPVGSSAVDQAEELEAGGLDDSSNSVPELDGDPEAIAAALRGMPVERAALIVKGLLGSLSPADQEKAVKIVVS